MKNNEVQMVAAYCRVSTDKEDQVSSFENQTHFFRKYIEEHPHWQLYQIYADEGITGTNTKKRKAFLHMIEDAKKGKFSLIVTKEISRFARNLLDSIYYTRELKQMGVSVYFFNDNIHTGDGDAELRLAILSSIAQEESRRTSERVKWGQKRSMEAGVVFGHSLLGYDLQNGKIAVNESGAAIVRLIFDQFLNKRKSISDIARILEKEGIKPKKAKHWNPSVILRILKNEKYCGDLIQKKTITPDYLSHAKKYNTGEEELVVLHNHHEAIISHETFEMVQTLLHEQKRKKPNEKFTRSYPFSGKVRCGLCGKRMSARVQTRKNRIYHLWRCHGKHPSTTMNNNELIEMMHMILQEYTSELPQLTSSVMKKLSPLSYMTGKEEIKEAKQKLLSLYLSGEIEKNEYLSAKYQYETEHQAITEDEIRSILTEEVFYGNILDEILIFENDAQIKLLGSSRLYEFDIFRSSRKRLVRMRK